MLCQICKKNIANVHLRSIINGRIKEIYMCSECAAKQRAGQLNYDGFSIDSGGDSMRFFENRFSEKAEAVIKYATESASNWGHEYVGTEHLLYGLLCDSNSVAASVLEENGINKESVETKIEEIIGINNTPCSVIGFTPRVKRVIETGFMEAKRLGQGFIGTEHMLMALLRDGESVASRIIAELGGEPAKIYNEILSNFGGGSYDDSYSERGMQERSKSGQKKGEKTPTLDEFGRDLTQMAGEGKFDPVIGREKEIERVIQILSRRTKNNPCLIGEPGVGKTAIAEGLAQKIHDGRVPEILKNKRVVSLDLSSMVAGAKYRGEFEDRLKKAIKEIKTAGNIILFIDEIHTIIGAGAAEGAIDASNILKPSLARGEIQLIGATTINEYRKHIEKDAALERRFQPVMVGEPTVDETIMILMGLRDKYEAHHKVEITDDALIAAANLSARYITDRFLPDKAIDLIDEAASKVKLKTYTAPDDISELRREYDKVKAEKEAAISTQDFEKAASLRDKEKNISRKLNEKKDNWKKENQIKKMAVTKKEIAEIVAEWTKIPVAKLEETESQRLLKLEDELHKRVIGQDEAVRAVAKAVKRGRTGLKDPKRPIGSFIFLGPTGVGKTELCKALAEAVFGDENAMIRIDMSEYMEKYNVSRLVGSPPGYVGYDEGGQLSEQVRRKPYSVVLFDEIEKAHPDVFNMLLQILEDGILTDSQGRKINFKNTIIIMTSNIGAKLITNPDKFLGFNSKDTKDEGDVNADHESVKEKVIGELKRTFRPEFINRIDDIIVFNKLTKDEIKQIARNMLKSLFERLDANEIKAKVTEEAVGKLADVGFDPNYGARPLRRTITNKIEDLIAEKMLDGTVRAGDSIVIGVENGEFTVSSEENKKDEPKK